MAVGNKIVANLWFIACIKILNSTTYLAVSSYSIDVLGPMAYEYYNSIDVN